MHARPRGRFQRLCAALDDQVESHQRIITTTTTMSTKTKKTKQKNSTNTESINLTDTRNKKGSRDERDSKRQLHNKKTGARSNKRKTNSNKERNADKKVPEVKRRIIPGYPKNSPNPEALPGRKRTHIPNAHRANVSLLNPHLPEDREQKTSLTDFTVEDTQHPKRFNARDIVLCPHAKKCTVEEHYHKVKKPMEGAVKRIRERDGKMSFPPRVPPPTTWKLCAFPGVEMCPEEEHGHEELQTNNADANSMAELLTTPSGDPHNGDRNSVAQSCHSTCSSRNCGAEPAKAVRSQTPRPESKYANHITITEDSDAEVVEIQPALIPVKKPKSDPSPPIGPKVKPPLDKAKIMATKTVMVYTQGDVSQKQGLIYRFVAKLPWVKKSQTHTVNARETSLMPETDSYNSSYTEDLTFGITCEEDRRTLLNKGRNPRQHLVFLHSVGLTMAANRAVYTDLLRRLRAELPLSLCRPFASDNTYNNGYHEIVRQHAIMLQEGKTKLHPLWNENPQTFIDTITHYVNQAVIAAMKLRMSAPPKFNSKPTFRRGAPRIRAYRR